MRTAWEYFVFNTEHSVLKATLARAGADGWEAFSLENYTGNRGDHFTRIYCKRPVEQKP